jgi:hypothetical protein
MYVFLRGFYLYCFWFLCMMHEPCPASVSSRDCSRLLLLYDLSLERRLRLPIVSGTSATSSDSRFTGRVSPLALLLL